MPTAAQLLQDLKAYSASHPALVGAAFGAATGAGVGAISSDEGQASQGALGGALAGLGVGAIGGGVSGGVRRLMEALTPTPLKAAVVGGLGGGVLAGRYAKSHLPSWVKERLDSESDLRGRLEADNALQSLHDDHKEASDMTNADTEKRAELYKQAEERLNAFDYGIDVFCDEAGINKAAFAHLCGVESSNFAQEALAWVLEQQASQTVQSNA